ncbi:MAG: hypothetical protein KAI79_12120 [Bacteroidales bacterium]|nr:hypothetical protein [Bacteroidales bacterium]
MSLEAVWLLVFAFPQFFPTLMIVLSKRTQGKKKLIWTGVSLLSVVVLPIVTILFFNGDFVNHSMVGYSYLYVWLLLCVFILATGKKKAKKLPSQANKYEETNNLP